MNEHINMTPIAHISFGTIYRFAGWTFEYSRNKPFGPWPYKADGEPRKRAGKKFYEMFGRFIKLPIEQQNSLEI